MVPRVRKGHHTAEYFYVFFLASLNIWIHSLESSMPSQRFLGSEASSVLDLQNGSSETIAPPPVTESSAHILPSQTLPLPANAEAVDDNQGPSSGLHDVVKKTDFWFNIQLSQLEKYAVDMAVAWANAGIPRQDALPLMENCRSRLRPKLE